VGDTSDGLKRMAGMLTVARAHNAVAAAAGMRRGVDLTRAYGRVREASGSLLLDLPLFAHNLAALSVAAEASFSLTARVMSMLGQAEHGDLSELEARALRALVPLAKLLTAKDAVAHASEAVEAFGGAGYVEDTGIPRLLRDAQVLPIWEGTTSVLSLDLLRGERTDGAVSALLVDLNKRLASARTAQPLDDVAARTERYAATLTADVRAWTKADEDVLRAHARDFALALGRAYTTALLTEHAAVRLTRYRDDRAARVATAYADRWLAASPPPLPTAEDLTATRKLLDIG
jgi:acyl-CoA dehydrogenase